MASYDILGNIALVKFKKGTTHSDKLKIAKKIMSLHKGVLTVLEKVDKFKGRLRKLKSKHILGLKTKEAKYKENGCVFLFNVDNCYFSPRLSQERAELASLIKKGEKVAVLFGGVAPYAIVLSKTGKPSKVVSVELNRECTKYALQNVRLNKLEKIVEVIQGDVKKIFSKLKDDFDRIIMARPNLKETYLNYVLPYVKKNCVIHYYGFCLEKDLEKMISEILKKCAENKREIKILKVKKAGDIGVRKFRYRVDFKIMNNLLVFLFTILLRC